MTNEQDFLSYQRPTIDARDIEGNESLTSDMNAVRVKVLAADIREQLLPLLKAVGAPLSVIDEAHEFLDEGETLSDYELVLEAHEFLNILW